VSGPRPRPTPDSPGWFASDPNRACAGGDTDLFYPPDEYPQSGRRPNYRTALTTCGRCPTRIKLACLRYAVVHKEQGVWGGSTDKDRDRLRQLLALRAGTAAASRQAKAAGGQEAAA
jgi:hypothetical protein